MLTLTIDVEQYGDPAKSQHFLTALEPLLEAFAVTGSKATFFCCWRTRPLLLRPAQ